MDRSSQPTRRNRVRTIPAFAALGTLLALASVPAPAVAQVVQGRITDESGAVPLRAAEVSLLADDGSVAVVEVSDSAGRYRIIPREPGNYSLRVDLLGYQRLVTPLLALEGDRTMLADFEMPPAPIELEGLDVEAEAEQRMRDELRMFGVHLDYLGERFVDRAAIEARSTARDFGHVLQYQSVPGLRITRSDDLPPNLQPLRSSMCVSVPRSKTTLTVECAVIALDGTLTSPEAAAMLPVESLQGMAILTPNEAVLAFGTDGRGGALLLFTR